MSDRKITSDDPTAAVEFQGTVLAPAKIGDSCARTFQNAAENRWSGALELSTDRQEVVGSAVFWQGRLGWATSASQTETLGSFLRRLGQVTKDDLDIVQALFAERGGETKLGKIMEETGVLPRRALRRCLRLHLRLAVASLLEKECVVSAVQAGPFCCGDDILFDIHEVVPEWAGASSEDAGGLPKGPSDAVTKVLESLKAIPGHSSSLIADREGWIIDTRGFGNARLPGPSIIAGTAVSLLESAMHSATWNHLGEVDFASTEGSNGAVLAHWLDPDRNYLAAVLLAPTGKVGIARYELAASAKIFRENSIDGNENGGRE